MTADLRAAALLTLIKPQLDRAIIETRGFTLISDSLGERVARWAYADRGKIAGHRMPSRISDALEEWEPSVDDWCLVLSGPAGIGKTVAAARYVAERGGLLLSAAAADGWGFGGGDGLRVAQRAAWLLVDDVGDEKTQVGAANLATLIADRAATGRRTICTTTLSPAEMKAKGDHLASRLQPHFKTFTGADKRSRISPSLRYVGRQFEVVSMTPRIQLLARGVSRTGPDEEALIERFAKLAGVDMASQAFADALAAEQVRSDEINAMFVDAERALTDLVARQSGASKTDEGAA